LKNNQLGLRPHHILGETVLKTFNKLKEICDPHGIEIDFDQDSFGYWQVLFHAPDGYLWNTTATAGNCFRNSTLKGVVGYIRGEIKEGLIEGTPNEHHNARHRNGNG
jgi:hypothetical protein